MDKKLLVIDTDCGVDDALAIILALSCKEEWNILAITCCNGNTSIENVCGNVFRLTNHFNRKEIPVYRGCPKSLLNEIVPVHQSFHGDDGFGSVASKYSTGQQTIQPESAALALVKLTQQNKGNITLVALGPLTNLSLAKRLDDNFDCNLKELVVMGGTIDSLGNATPCGEFNFVTDPESAFIVLNEFICPMKIFPWETCVRFLVPWEFYEKWTSLRNPVSTLIADLTAHSVGYIKSNILRPGYHSPDLLAMATLLKPSVVTKTVTDCPVTVELSGKISRGQMIVDRRSVNRRGKAQGNIEIITELDMEAVLQLLMIMVQGV